MEWTPKRPRPASLSRDESVDGATPTPSCVPKGKEIDRGGAVGMRVGSDRSVYEMGGLGVGESVGAGVGGGMGEVVGILQEADEVG